MWVQASSLRGWGPVAAGSKKKKNQSGSGWTWRLAGIALCVFFALGVITGLSQSGRIFARRLQSLLRCLPHSSRSELIPTAYRAFLLKDLSTDERGQSSPETGVRARTDTIALLQRPDGLYQLDSWGRVSGPVPSADTADVPILSGDGVENAPASQLLDYASEIVRAEAILSAIISEMQVMSSGDVRIYLDRPRLMIVLAGSQYALQLARAARVLEVWRRHSDLIGMLDMTIPDEAIVSPKSETIQHLDRASNKTDLYGRRVESASTRSADHLGGRN
jgi:hypothetical protein